MRSSSNPDAVVAVAVPVPGLGLLHYRVRGGHPPRGARVEVPVGSRTLTGCVVDSAATAPPGAELRDVTGILDDEPFLPSSIVALAMWIAEYYACGPGDAMAIAMPPSARGRRADAFRRERAAAIIPGVPVPSTLRPKQQAALDRLAALPSGVSLGQLSREGISHAVVNALARHGLVRLLDLIRERDPFVTTDDDGGAWALARPEEPDRALSEEQAAALRELTFAADHPRPPILLHGVTGSGKTEIYLRLAAHVIATGRRVLVLVPEIALTPAVTMLFRSRFGSRVAIQHSGLSAGERHDQWHRIRRGDVDVVVGTRSAVLAPIEKLGLIVVDEEHEGSYKQEELPRYHARDVAVMRGSMERVLVVLGSATPSLESAQNAESGRYGRLRLTSRILNRPLASVQVVDMRKEYARRGATVTLSEPLLRGIADRLSRQEQSLVLLNRRGFATAIFCRECGQSFECPHCSVSLTYHRGARRVRCHYCDYSARVPERCGQCGGAYLEQSGVGTERLEADLVAAFPGARIARVDRDTIRRRGAIRRVLSSVNRGETDILVGTQMIAKGHDFPSVTLVGVVSADVGLGLADFRAAERTFQLLTQVVGRAGRGEVAGEAIVQTIYPDHYSVRAAAAQDYDEFYAREMEFRKSLHYPPAMPCVNLVVKGRTLDAAMRDAGDLAAHIRASRAGQVVGPAPAAVAKLKDEFRVQCLIKGRGRRHLRESVLAALAARPDLRRRTIIDIDPMTVL